MNKQRRNVGDLHQPNQAELLLNIKQMDTKRDRALAAFIYLTGCRISEIIGKTKQVAIYEGKGKDRKVIDHKPLVIEPLKKESILLDTGMEGVYLVENVHSLKHRHNSPTRNIPLKNKGLDSDYIMLFFDYLGTLQDGEPLFKLTRQQAWNIINKQLGLFPHMLIHLRCSHLTVHRGFTDHYLKQLRGWKDTRPAAVYVHMGFKDVANKL